MAGQSVNCVGQLEFHAPVIINGSNGNQVIIKKSRQNSLKQS